MFARSLCVVLPIALAGCLGLQTPTPTPTPPRVALSDGWLAMGTFFEADLRIRERDRRAALAWLEWARVEVARLEAIYSRYAPDSQLSQLNRSLVAENVLLDGARVGPELEALLFESLGVWEASGGAFDVTVGPLVEVFSRAAADGRWPSVEQLRRAKRRVGSERLLMPGGGELGVTVPNVRIDLDGISKGAVLDRLAAELKARLPGAAARLDFGQSSVVAIGAPDEGGWRLVVESRDPASGRLGIVTLRDQALSVSSSVGSIREVDGVAVSHVIDPRTGAAVEGTVEAIVLADRAALADAWSTALLVLGAGAGAIERVEKAGLDAYVFETGGRSQATEGWEQAASGNPEPARPDQGLGEDRDRR